MKQLKERTCLLYVMLVVIIVNSLGCGNSLETNSLNSDAMNTKINLQTIDQKRAKPTSFEETIEGVAEVTGVVLGVTATVAWEVVKVMAECPCFWHHVISH